MNFIPQALHRLKSIASINLTTMRFSIEGKGVLSKIRHINALFVDVIHVKEKDPRQRTNERRGGLTVEVVDMRLPFDTTHHQL